jgi:predicted amidophosphoribosyltransferase
MPPPLVIGYVRGAWHFNNVLLSKAQVLEEIRKAATLVPRPRVYLRFARNDYDPASSMAKEIQGAGGCDDRGCLFRVTER